MLHSMQLPPAIHEEFAMCSRLRCLAFLGCFSALVFTSSGRGESPVKSGPAKDAPGSDLHGDPLPAGARARLGTIRFRYGSTVVRLAASPDGKRLASLGTDQIIRIWDVADGRQLRAISPR